MTATPSCFARAPVASRQRWARGKRMAAVTIAAVHKSLRLDRRCCTASTSRSPTASSACSSAPRAAASRTLLRMIAGLENITGGEIAIGGRVVNQVPPKERDIAMVFQNYALYPHMTVRDNMALLARRWRRKPKAVIDERVAQGRRHPRPDAAASTAIRASSRAASASAWRWAAPSCATRRCSCSTSRCPTSTPSCAWRCAPRSRSCTSA